jgi:hypothetical protein
VQKDSPRYLKLIKNGYWELTDIEFNEALEETIDNVKAGDIPLILYFRGFDIFTHLYKDGLIQENEDQLYEIFSNGLEIAASNAKSISDSLYYFKDIDLTHKPRLKMIMEMIIEINQGLLKDTESFNHSRMARSRSCHLNPSDHTFLKTDALSVCLLMPIFENLFHK